VISARDHVIYNSLADTEVVIFMYVVDIYTGVQHKLDVFFCKIAFVLTTVSLLALCSSSLTSPHVSKPCLVCK